MLAKARDTGAMILCDGCQTPIDAAGLVLWKFHGKPQDTVLVVHTRCAESPVVKMFMPEYRSQPLGQYLEALLEKLSV